MLTLILLYCTSCYMFKKGYFKVSKKDYIKNALMVHNIISILLNAYIFIGMCAAVLQNNYTLVGNIMNYTHVNIIHYIWFFHLSQYYQLVDSIFIMMRNKIKQLNSLHVYTRMSMLVYTWLIMVVHPGGDMYMEVLLNSWAHMWMYVYLYFTVTFGLKFRMKYFWWNKLLILNQLAYFGANLIYVVISSFYGTHLWLSVFGFLHQLSIIALFWKHNYKRHVCRTSLIIKMCKTSQQLFDELNKYELKNNRLYINNECCSTSVDNH